jgi:hypothetical protein
MIPMSNPSEWMASETKSVSTLSIPTIIDDSRRKQCLLFASWTVYPSAGLGGDNLGIMQGVYTTEYSKVHSSGTDRLGARGKEASRKYYPAFAASFGD